MKHQLIFLSVIFFAGALFSQTPTEIQTYLKNNIRIYYLADANTNVPDIREIKTSNIEQALGNNILFGKKDNNRMDVSALFLRALLNSKAADVKLQKDAYELMKKIGKPVVLAFVNDVAVSIDKQYLSQYGFFYYEKYQKIYLWPAAFSKWTKDASAPYQALIFGEYFNKNLSQLNDIFLDLLQKISTGKYGAVDLKGKIPGQGRVSNTVRYKTDIPRLTPAQLALWKKADVQQLGVIGNDWDGKDEIGTAPVQRQVVYRGINVGPNVLNFWYPNVRPSDNNRAWRQTLIGRLKSEAEHFNQDNWFPDHDIDFYIIPDPPYEYLIKENPKPSISLYSGLGNLINDHAIPNCPAIHDHVEAEIDLDNTNEKQFLTSFNDFTGARPFAGFYGTWIYDRGHCDHPEIHPAEQIWWSYQTDYVYTTRCHLVCDYSRRYDRPSQFDSDGGKYSVMKPWGEPPVKGVFALPFELQPGAERITYRIFQHDYNNLNANNSVLFDNARVHHLILDGKTLVSVVEPEVKCMNVNFEQVGFDASGNLKGFIVITSAVGKYNMDRSVSPGHLFFEVKKYVQNLKTAVKAPGKIKVTLESIECLGVDDGNDAEEIYGTITCSAYSVKDTVTYAMQRLPFTTNLGASNCPAGPENMFCLPCDKWLVFKKGTKSTFGGSFTYDFPTDGYIVINGDLDEADSDNCKDFDYLGEKQKTFILANEVGPGPLRFTQYFASGKTVIRANFKAERVR